MTLRALLLALALLPVAGAARAQEGNDLRQFRIGMPAADLPAHGYTGFTCAADPTRKLAGWSDYAACPADSRGWHELRFRYDPSADPLAGVSDEHEGTKVGGQPVLLSLLIGNHGTLRGIRIETDPHARLYMHKKAFLLADQAKARYGAEGWTCENGKPTADKEPVGGVFYDQHCTKTTATRHYVLDRELYRRPGEDLKSFTGGTQLLIEGASR